MEVVESQSILRRVVRFLQEPFQKIKERWLAYFAELGMDGGASSTDLETELQSSHDLLSWGDRPATRGSRSRKDKQSEYPINRFTFITSILGTTVGLGHLWRFPSVAYKMGGGTFLFIYLILTLIFGYTIHFLELASGQYASLSSLRIFDKIPLMQGVGYAMVAYSYLLTIYNTQMIGIGIHFLASSFDFNLPWSQCPEFESPYNITRCQLIRDDLKPQEVEVICPKGVMVIDTDKLCTDPTYRKEVERTCCSRYKQVCPPYTLDDLCRKREIPSMYYWTTNIVQPYPRGSPHEGYLGEANLKLLLCLFVAWFLVYLFVSIGMKWSGILAMTITPFMLIALMLMVPVVVNSDGAWNGLMRFFVPQIKTFAKGEIWLAALEQCLYSLGIGMGLVLSFGSISHFKSPCHIDPIIVAAAVVFSSVLSGSVVFSVIGSMAAKSGAAFEKAVTAGPGVAVVAYSEMLTKLPAAWLCSAIFFTLFALVGIVSVSGIITSISITISDLVKITKKDRFVLNFILVFTCFLFGIPFIMRGGLILLAALDLIPGGIALPQICLFELISLYLYGIDFFCEDIAFMMGFYPNRYFRYSWMAYPVFLVPASVYAFASVRIPKMKTWLIVTAWTVYALIVSPVFIFMCKNLAQFGVKNNVKGTIERKPGFGPKSEELKSQRNDFHTTRHIF